MQGKRINEHTGKEDTLRISVFGLGYVGTVSAGCLAYDGHEVIGVDPVQAKVDIINAGQSPIIEASVENVEPVVPMIRRQPASANKSIAAS